MISRIRIASSGRDLGIQIYNQEMLEWQEHLRGVAGEKPEKKAAEPSPSDDFIKNALSIFDSPTKQGGG